MEFEIEIPDMSNSYGSVAWLKDFIKNSTLKTDFNGLGEMLLILVNNNKKYILGIVGDAKDNTDRMVLIEDKLYASWPINKTEVQNGMFTYLTDEAYKIADDFIRKTVLAWYEKWQES